MKPTERLTLIAALALAVSLTGCHTHIVEPDYYPPAPPVGLYTETGDGFIELFWAANREPDVAGYNVYVSSVYEGPYGLIGSSPEGYGVIVQDSWARPDLAGYDFSAYSVLPYDASGSDIYYEYTGGEYYMVVRTDSDIMDMGPTGSLLDVRTVPAAGWSATHDVRLRVGHTYVVWTWDDHYAKFRVTSLSTGRVVFDWAYQLQVGTPLLKRAAGDRRPVAETLLGLDRIKGN
jgi:hypothetical protein